MKRRFLALFFMTLSLSIALNVQIVSAQSLTFDYGSTAQAVLDEDGTLTVTGEDSIYEAGNIKNAIGADNVSKVTKLVIGGNITRIYSYNFAAMTNLKEIVIGDNVTEIDMNAFENDVALNSIELGSGIKSFRVSGKVQNVLKEVKVNPDSPYLTVVDGVLFSRDRKELIYYPASLEAVAYTIPDTVETIGYQAFRYVSNLETIVIPDSVKTISSYAFQYSSGIRELIIPESVQKLEYGAFMDAGVDKIIYKGTANPGERCFDSCDSLTSLEITSDQVTEIGYCAVSDCSRLKEVILPDSVKKIGIRAFENDSSLKYINVPGGLETIEARAFYGCALLMDFTFPRSVIYVGGSAFEGTQVTNRPEWLTVTGNGAYSTLITINYTGTVDYDEAMNLLNKVNEYRTENGCTKLELDDSLNAGAVIRAEELPILLNSGRLDSSDGLKVAEKAERQTYTFGATTEAAYKYLIREYADDLKESQYVSCGIACFYQGYSRYYSLFLSGSAAEYADVKSGQQYVRVNRNCEFNVITDDSFAMTSDLSIKVGKSKQVVTGVREYDAYMWYSYSKSRLLQLNPDSFVYDTSDHQVATVDQNGMVTGHSAGECTLYIYAKETKKWCKEYTITVTGEGNDGYVDEGEPDVDSQDGGDIEEDPGDDTEDVYYSKQTNFYVTGNYEYEAAFEHLRLLNEMRVEQGVEPLVMDKQLLEAAMIRSAECLMMFDHIRPCNEKLNALCSYANGENIAAAARSPRQALLQFYYDEPHRENMLDSRWKSVGIGVFVQGDMIYYLQDFSEYEAREEAVEPENGSEKVSLTIPCYTGYAARDKFIYSPTETMKIGDSKTIRIATYNFTYDDWGTSKGIIPDNKTFKFINKTPDLVDVDENGVVTAKAAGNWKIIARLPSNSDINIICVGGITEYGSGYDTFLSQEEYDADRNRFVEKDEEEDNSGEDDHTEHSSDGQDQKENGDNFNDTEDNGATQEQQDGTENNNRNEDGSNNSSNNDSSNNNSSNNNSSNNNSSNNNSNNNNNSSSNRNNSNNSYSDNSSSSPESDSGHSNGQINDGNLNNDLNQSDNSNNNTSTNALPQNQNDNGAIYDYNDDKEYTYHIPAKVKGLKATNKKSKKLKLSWKKAAYADGYQLQYAKNKKFTQAKKTKTVSGTTYTIKKLSKNKTYYVRVRAYTYDSSGNRVYGSWSTVIHKKIKK